ncbi:hypothetical protein KCP73_18530 [Salmonella enterica subsp. enterica]|nr:hypothetical protein KCP73_18530 [Salmonella enterica subsp. enterica]
MGETPSKEVSSIVKKESTSAIRAENPSSPVGFASQISLSFGETQPLRSPALSLHDFSPTSLLIWCFWRPACHQIFVDKNTLGFLQTTGA